MMVMFHNNYDRSIMPCIMVHNRLQQWYDDGTMVSLSMHTRWHRYCVIHRPCVFLTIYAQTKDQTSKRRRNEYTNTTTHEHTPINQLTYRPTN